jgi:hypothetical protein
MLATLQMAFHGLSDSLLSEEESSFDPLSSSLLFDAGRRLDSIMDAMQARKRAVLGESAASLLELNKIR